MSATWPWLALAGLGAFHGLNPAMGWLFAVARGLQRGSRTAVLQSMLPIAAGHALSIAVVVAAVGLLSAFVDTATLHLGAGAVLIGFGLYRLLARHRGRAGMQVGPGQLLVWSFLMASAHGAGLMLVPVLLAMPGAVADPAVIARDPSGVVHGTAGAMHGATGMMHGAAGMAAGSTHMAAMSSLGTSAQAAFAAVGVHTLAMLIVATAVAVAVYDWLGLSFLRRGWINLDLVWVATLVGAGVVLLVTA